MKTSAASQLLLKHNETQARKRKKRERENEGRTRLKCREREMGGWKGGRKDTDVQREKNGKRTAKISL